MANIFYIFRQGCLIRNTVCLTFFLRKIYTNDINKGIVAVN